MTAWERLLCGWKSLVRFSGSTANLTDRLGSLRPAADATLSRLDPAQAEALLDGTF
jgi:hypothetical protein